MTFIEIDIKHEPIQNKKLIAKIIVFGNLIDELKGREIPENIIELINKEILAVNSITTSEKMVLKQMRKAQRKILQILEKELKLVTKNHYRNFYLAVGMTVFGIPIGTAIGSSIGNMAFIGIGMVIGMAIGISIGTAKDKEAKEKGFQIDIEFKN